MRGTVKVTGEERIKKEKRGNSLQRESFEKKKIRH
jgi:hypothetical protein